MKSYFGTDGIRGVAGQAPLDEGTVYAVGRALADDLRERHGGNLEVVLGEDTRESSRWIAETLAAGLHDGGSHVLHAGVLPTPGVAYLARTTPVAAGVMISASHNPYQDNGIKVFGHTGYKLPDAEEAAIEAAIDSYLYQRLKPRRQSIGSSSTLRDSYIASLSDRVKGVDFSRLKVVVDCANGAASTVADPLFRGLGLSATIIEDQPDGRNINAGAGALHPEHLAKAVRSHGAHAGVALDGDADRAILVDAEGNIVNGDSVLLMAARELRRRHQLDPPVIVGTLMTNLGLELALKKEEIRLVRAAVGDKYVWEKMLEHSARLGGEPSGHIIFAGEATTGDGLLTALRCFELMAREKQSLQVLCDGWKVLPQRIVNVRVREKVPFENLPTVRRAMQSAEQYFGSNGRILVRYSGTEKLARVMVEAESEADVVHHAEAIAAAIQQELGT